MTAFPAHRRDSGPVAPGAAPAPGADTLPPGAVITALTSPPEPARQQPGGPAHRPVRGPAGAGTGPVPKLRVTVTRLGPGGSREDRAFLDTEQLTAADGRRLHALVDAVEVAGPPAGSTFGLVRRPAGSTPRYEVNAARGFGHWSVTVPVGVKGTALAALIERVRGVPGDS